MQHHFKKHGIMPWKFFLHFTSTGGAFVVDCPRPARNVFIAQIFHCVSLEQIQQNCIILNLEDHPSFYIYQKFEISEIYMYVKLYPTLRM